LAPLQRTGSASGVQDTLRPSSDFTPSPSHLQHTHFSPPRMKLFRITHLADMTEGELCARSFIAADPRIYDPEFTFSGQDSAFRCIPSKSRERVQKYVSWPALRSYRFHTIECHRASTLQPPCWRQGRALRFGGVETAPPSLGICTLTFTPKTRSMFAAPVGKSFQARLQDGRGQDIPCHNPPSPLPRLVFQLHFLSSNSTFCLPTPAFCHQTPPLPLQNS